jgi:aminoglycoside 6'-N-acetyltransferase I
MEEAGEGPVGIVEASVVSSYEIYRPKSVLHIRSLYVKPSSRGQGIGRKLLEAALEWGRGKGCQEVDLNVLLSNPARKLYESLGFTGFELKMRLGL